MNEIRTLCKAQKERYTHLNAEFQRIAKRDKKAFLRDQCKEIEENNRMGKTRDLFKKTRDTKGTFHAKMGSIKDRNVPLVSLIFLKWSLFFPILLFSSILCIDHWGRLSYLSLLYFGTLHSDGITFLFFFVFHFSSFSAICKASSDKLFAFLHFFFLGMVLITASSTNVTNLHP